MRSRVVLQPTLTMTTSSSPTQEARFARRVGHGKTGVVFVNVYRTSTSGTITFGIETASETAVRADTTNPFWLSCVAAGAANTFSAALISGALKFKIENLGEWVRYNVAGIPAATDFDIVIYFADT